MFETVYITILVVSFSHSDIISCLHVTSKYYGLVVVRSTAPSQPLYQVGGDATRLSRLQDCERRSSINGIHGTDTTQHTLVAVETSAHSSSPPLRINMISISFSRCSVVLNAANCRHLASAFKKAPSKQRHRFVSVLVRGPRRELLRRQ